MNVLHELRLKGTMLFKDATLKLDRVGLTTIKGMNLDAKNTQKASNGSGKSHLMSFLPEIAFDSTPLTKDIKTRSKKDRLIKDSVSEIDMTSRDKRYTIQKLGGAKSYDFEVLEDGKEIGVRTKGYARQKIDSLFNYISEDEFYTLWYVDSRRPSDLQFGSPAKRMEFFTRLFRLEKHDSIRKIFNTLMTEAKQDGVLHARLRQEYDSYKEDLANTEDVDGQIQKLNESLIAVSDRLEKGFRSQQRYESMSKLQEEFDNLKELCREFKVRINVDSLKDTIRKFSKDVEKANELLNQMGAYEVYVASMEQYAEEKRHWDKVRTDLDKATLRKAAQAIEILKEKGPEASLLEAKLEKLHSNFSSTTLKELLKKYPEEKVKKIKERHSELHHRIKEGQQTVADLCDLIDNHGQHFECPTCHQEVTAPKKTVGALRKQLSEWQEEQKNVVRHMERIAETLELNRAKEEIDDASKELEAINSRLARCKKFLKANSLSQNDDVASMLDAVMSLATLRKPKKVEKPDVPKNVERKREFVSVAKSLIPHLDEVTKLSDMEDPTPHIKKLKQKQEDLNAQIIGLTTKSEISKKARKRMKQIKQEISEYSDSVDDLPILQDLAEAFSNKGIKLLLIKRIAQFIEANMNKYASLLYFEKVKFTFNVTEKEFSILFERTYKGKRRVADVRSLSGAESRAFTFLFPLAIMPLIPVNRRINLMILDEPTVNMDDMMRDLFINSFIPKLNSVVPHVIVITPLNEQYRNAEEFYVVKKGGQSNLVPAKELGSYMKASK